MRIYSRALTTPEIRALARGKTNDESEPINEPIKSGNDTDRSKGQKATAICATRSDNEDSILPAAAALFGVLVGVAFVGIGASGLRLVSLLLVIAAAPPFFLAMSKGLPALNWVLMPLTSLAAVASVLFSTRD